MAGLAFILILIFGTNAKAVVDLNTLATLCASLVVGYALLCRILKFLLDNSADREEVDKEISLLIVIGAFFLLVNNPELININKTELLLANESLLRDFNKFLNMSLLISIELLIYSFISYFFGFKKINKDEYKDKNKDKNEGKDKYIYDINYTCEEKLTGEDKDNKQSEDKDNEQSKELIAPILFLLNTTKIILIFVAIIFIPIIFELEGADYIRNLAASAGGSITILAIIFREGAKSFTAGIRIHMDDLLRIGHKIRSEILEINGRVEEISITNIKVRNLDHTVTNVPIDKLLSSPFYNISTREDFGRRVNLIIYIFIPTIKKLNQEHLISEEALLENYFDCKKNGKTENSERVFTNIGSYKAYLKSYLYHHGLIQRDKNIIVRSLNKTDRFGYIPIQIKAYTLASIKDSKTFRTIESDIMDHALSKLSAFELRASESKSESN